MLIQLGTKVPVSTSTDYKLKIYLRWMNCFSEACNDVIVIIIISIKIHSLENALL